MATVLISEGEGTSFQGLNDDFNPGHRRFTLYLGLLFARVWALSANSLTLGILLLLFWLVGFSGRTFPLFGTGI